MLDARTTISMQTIYENKQHARSCFSFRKPIALVSLTHSVPIKMPDVYFLKNPVKISQF